MEFFLHITPLIYGKFSVYPYIEGQNTENRQAYFSGLQRCRIFHLFRYYRQKLGNPRQFHSSYLPALLACNAALIAYCIHFVITFLGQWIASVVAAQLSSQLFRQKFPFRTSFIRNDQSSRPQAFALTTSRFATHTATYRSAYSYDYPLIFCVLRDEVVFEVYIKRQWAGCGGLGYMLDAINAEVAVVHP